MTRQYLEAIATLVGTIIGAGVLGIPYVVAKSGIWIGLGHILFLGIAVLFINLYVAEISLRTKKTHQLAGYAERFLGKTGKAFITIATIIGVYGALIAYLIGQGESWGALLGVNPFTAMIAFFVIMSIFIFVGLNIIKGWELYLSLFMVFILLIIIALALPGISLSNFANVDYSNLFLPYGVILFAFIGALAIPEMKEILIHQKKRFKSAVMIGSLIPLAAYALFAVAVVGMTGIKTNQIATIGLGEVLGTHMVILGNFFAILSMATSFLALGLGLKWMYQFDYGMNKHLAFILTMAIPLIIVLLKVTDFVQILGITGSLAGGLTGILIVFMLHRARRFSERRPEFKVRTNVLISGTLVAIFVGGIIYTLLNLPA